MSVTEAAWGLTSFVFSIKPDVTDDKNLKEEKSNGPTQKVLRDLSGNFSSPGEPPRPWLELR